MVPYEWDEQLGAFFRYRRQPLMQLDAEEQAQLRWLLMQALQAETSQGFGAESLSWRLRHRQLLAVKAVSGRKKEDDDGGGWTRKSLD